VTPVLNMRRTVTVDHELHGQHHARADDPGAWGRLLRAVDEAG
jgi:hypothetical protein